MREIPKVSIIVPNYNHGAYLRKRIDSVLNQTFQDFELILLDDCSTDNSVDILESYNTEARISHIEINKKNTGKPFQQWVKGIELAKGKYIWIAESDDYADNDFLEKTVAQLEMHPEAQLCMTGSNIVDSNGIIIYSADFDKWEEDGRAYKYQASEFLASKMFSQNSVYNASCVVFRRKDSLKGIDLKFKEMRYCGDWLFWIEQIRKGPIIILHEKLNYFRKHGYNTTAKGALNGNSFPEIIYIKSLFYSKILKKEDNVQIVVDKSRLYRYVKHLDVKKERRKELFGCLKTQLGINYISYQKGRIYRSWNKHVRRRKI